MRYPLTLAWLAATAATAVASPAGAQTGSQPTACFKDRADASDSLAGVTAGPYPFDVARIRYALSRFKEPPTGVSVEVVDNGFAGYIDDNQGYRASVAFPEVFFYREDGRSVPTRQQVAPSAKDASGWGHGTHVTGLVLGGMYGQGALSADDPGKPDVRSLFFDGFVSKRAAGDSRDPRDWLKVFVYPLRQSEEDEYNVARILLMDKDKKSARDFKPDILNMSFEHRETLDNTANLENFRNLPKNFPNSLVVVSAGNDSTKLDVRYGPFPAMSRSEGNLIVVGAHNTDYGPSAFTNFDPDRVTLAAPGCALASWASNRSAPLPLNGTSQAAAVVSFGAALLKSRWPASPNDLRERLIASSRYSRLLNGGCTDGNAKVGCTLFGNALDIEMALYVDVDAVEYCVKPGQTAPGCKTRVALGLLTEAPPWVTGCTDPINAVEGDEKLRFGMLTAPSAIRAVETGAHEILYRTQLPGYGGGTFARHRCAEGPESGTFVLELPASDVEQPPGPPIEVGPDRRLTLAASQVVRIVTRSYGTP